jgi:YgiT-type zinc finger domain-containing protein
MSGSYSKETIIETRVTYTIELDGRVVVIENVPARVCMETGERLFSPQTVERIQQIVKSKPTPKRTISTPVYEFAA